MAQDRKGLTLGSGRVRIAGRYVGQVSDIRLERDVTKAEHMTNVDIEFRRDFVLPVETRMGLSWTFGEIIPHNVNFLFGGKGFRSVPADRSLASMPTDPYIWGDPDLVKVPLVHTEYPTMCMSLDSQPVWSPLTYPLINGQVGAQSAPRSVSAQNQAAPVAAPEYVGFFVTAAGLTGSDLESLPSNVAIVAHNAAAGSDGDAVTLIVQLNADHVAATTLRVFRYHYHWSSTYGCYFVPNGETASNHLYDLGTPDWYVISAGDVTAGYATISVTCKKAAIAGAPPTTSFALSSWDGVTTYDWLEDYEIMPSWKGGAAIRLNPESTAVGQFDTCKFWYYYDANQIIESPFGVSGGENPVVPVTVEYPFPDGLSKIIVALWRVQVNSSVAFALTERDWMGVPFAGDALDASELYPAYPYGYYQFMGPMARRAVAGGNFAMTGTSSKPYELGDKTTWA